MYSYGWVAWLLFLGLFSSSLNFSKAARVGPVQTQFLAKATLSVPAEVTTAPPDPAIVRPVQDLIVDPALVDQPTPNAFDFWRTSFEQHLDSALNTNLDVLNILLKHGSMVSAHIDQFQHDALEMLKKSKSIDHTMSSILTPLQTSESQASSIAAGLEDLKNDMAVTNSNFGQKHAALDAQIKNSLRAVEKHNTKRRTEILRVDSQFQDLIGKMEASAADFEKQFASVSAETGAPTVAPVAEDALAAPLTPEPATTVAPTQELPPGWEQRVNSTGRTYYADHNTESTHWEAPTAPVAPVAAATTEALATTAAPAQLPPGWEQSVNSTGRTYYVDHNTKSTHWEAPTAPVAPTATPPATGTTAVPPPPSPLPPTGTQLPLGNASGTINVTSYAGSTTVSPGGVQSAAVTGAPGPDPALTPPPPTAFEASATFPPPPPSGTGAVGADAWMYEQTPTVLPEEVQAGTMPHGLPLAPPPEITPPFGTHGHVSMPPPPPLIPLPVHPYDETPLSVPAYEAKLGTSTEDIIRRTPAPGTSVEAAMAWNPPADPVGPGAAVMMTAHHWTCSCDDASGQQAALSVRHDDPGLKMAGEFTLDDSGPDEALAKAQTQDTALRKKTSRTMRNK